MSDKTDRHRRLGPRARVRREGPLATTLAIDARDRDIRRVQTALGLAAENPTDIDRILDDLGPTFFATEDGWRSAFNDFRRRPGVAVAVKLLALQEYLRFLQAARAGAPAAPTADPGDLPTDERPADAGPPGAHFGTEGGTRLAIDVLGPGADFGRLPPRRTTRLSGQGDTPLVVWLAERRVTIEPGHPPVLRTPDGARHPLRDGRVYVGRAPYNDVVLDPSWGDVSRQHLLLDVVDGRVRAATDLSSRGTFLPRAVVGIDWC